MLTQKRLGATSWTDIASGLTSGVAKDIVSQAEGPARKLIQRERHNFANGVISGLPFFGLGTMAYIGTRYFVPDDKKMAKGVGYLVAAAIATVGGWYTANEIAGPEPTPAPDATATPGSANAIAQNAAKAIVVEAEPKIRKIVDEERARIAEAGQAGLPLAIGSAAAFLCTWLLVDDKNSTMKALGYTGSAALLGAGIWVALEKEKEVA
jgi:hypothetical protein